MKFTSLLFILFCNFTLQAQVNIRFELKDIPKSKDSNPAYFLAGNFNGWNPNDTSFKFLKTTEGHYALTKQLNSGQYEFKITRGNWLKVETEQKGNNRPNRTLSLKNDTTISISVLNWSDEFKPIPPNRTASKNVKLMDSAFFIPQLNVKRRIWLYLPPSYQTSSRKYPVLYMHDGQNLFDEATAGYGEWGVDEVLDQMSANGAPESIVVAIDHGGSERLKEYNPYDSEYGKAKGKLYVDFLVNTLKPYIDAHYRTKTEAKNTAIAGSSMGGLISMYAIISYPKIFGKVGVFSPAFWVGKKIEEELKLALPNLTTNQFYFVAGALEGSMMIRDMNAVVKILSPDTKNRNVKVVEKADGEHKEWFWHREFTEFYKFISK